MLRSGRICTEANEPKDYVNERGLRATFVGATGPQDRRLAMVQMHQPGSAHGHNFRRAQPVAAPSEIAAPTSAPRGAENPTDRPSFRASCRQTPSPHLNVRKQAAFPAERGEAARILGRVLINQEARRGAFDVRLSPNSGAKADIAGDPRRANSRLMQRSK
jgi:hypothetical protein